MTAKTMHFERRYEFGASIVWDALVDADLVSGWLAEAEITPRLGGRYHLQWLNPASMAPCDGRIIAFEPRKRLSIETYACGVLAFTLIEVEGGSRGMSTDLSVDIITPHAWAVAARVQADWLTNLDQLAGLLRGHPVDWSNWERDHAGDWAAHFVESESEARRQ